ncbi:hypothetical protein [Antarcticirhabdus aurantiaca]|uniref:Uncharacterized protein n=1 Tax=Antarcticirhabdus aurantiaca TaxID=2606717 RepID=A0ACD4NRU6_9HYPH|nr:hypothetical protein [Antarcticirhabdus aurantiaca]WAJ29433.1 hypothetical protein OXU80_04130 [Jeongeuplla avenae]
MFDIKQGRIYGIDGDDYRLDGKTGDGFLMRSVDCPGVTQHFTEAELAEIMERGMLSVRMAPVLDRKDGTVGSVCEGTARRRLCRAFLALRDAGEASLSERSMEDAIATIIGGDTYLAGRFEGAMRGHGPGTGRIRVTPAKLRRWLRRYADGQPTRPVRSPALVTGGERNAAWEALASRAADIGRSPDHIHPSLLSLARRHGTERALRVWSMCVSPDARLDGVGIGGAGRTEAGRIGGHPADEVA